MKVVKPPVEEVEDKDLIPTHCIIIYPVYGNFQNFNAAKYGLDIFKIDDAKFKALNENEFLEKRIDALKNIQLLGQAYIDCCYVITENGYDPENLWNFYNFLLMAKPSPLLNPIAHFTIEYHEVDGVKQKFRIGNTAIWDDIDLTGGMEKPLIIFDHEFETFYLLFDSFIKKFENKDEDFLKLFGIYRAAVRNKEGYLKFLILMIVVECLINDTDKAGVTYKICRTAAILLGSYPAASEIIFNNLKILYGDRSNFVHKGEVNYLTPEKIDYHHHLVCVILATMLLGNVSLNALFNAANKYGFGQREALLNELGIKDDRIFRTVAAKLITVLTKKGI